MISATNSFLSGQGFINGRLGRNRKLITERCRSGKVWANTLRKQILSPKRNKRIGNT